MTGIYAIVNVLNGKRYVGSAVDIQKRWAEHKRRLDANSHANKYLQAAWNKNGADAFNFVIIAYLPCETEYSELLAVEQRYINELLTDDGRRINRKIAYNIATLASGVRLCGEDHYNYGQTPTDESRRKMSEAHRGKTHSEETKRRMSESRTGMKRTDEAKRRIGDAKRGAKNPMYGKTISAEHKAKISAASRGANNPKARAIIQYDTITGEAIARYETVMDAGRALGISHSRISAACRGKQKTARGFRWAYADAG